MIYECINCKDLYEDKNEPKNFVAKVLCEDCLDDIHLNKVKIDGYKIYIRPKSLA